MSEQQPWPVGTRRGAWTVTGALTRNASGALEILCTCDCGTETPVSWWNLRNGKTSRCGACHRAGQRATNHRYTLAATQRREAKR